MPSGETFTRKWTRDGALMTSHQIVKALRDQCKEEDDYWSKKAQEEYMPEEFKRLFSYKGKGGTSKVLVDKKSIGKRYLQLTGYGKHKAGGLAEDETHSELFFPSFQ